MRTTTVTTSNELKSAKENNYDEIIVLGNFAKKLKRAKKITTLSAFATGILIVSLGTATATAPLTGGLSYFAVAPVAVETGLDIPLIIIAASIGIALILAIFKDYEEIYCDSSKIVLRKKQK